MSGGRMSLLELVLELRKIQKGGGIDVYKLKKILRKRYEYLLGQLNEQIEQRKQEL